MSSRIVGTIAALSIGSSARAIDSDLAARDRAAGPDRDELRPDLGQPEHADADDERRGDELRHGVAPRLGGDERGHEQRAVDRRGAVRVRSLERGVVDDRVATLGIHPR